MTKENNFDYVPDADDGVFVCIVKGCRKRYKMLGPHLENHHQNHLRGGEIDTMLKTKGLRRSYMIEELRKIFIMKFVEDVPNSKIALVVDRKTNAIEAVCAKYRRFVNGEMTPDTTPYMAGLYKQLMIEEREGKWSKGDTPEETRVAEEPEVQSEDTIAVEETQEEQEEVEQVAEPVSMAQEELLSSMDYHYKALGDAIEGFVTEEVKKRVEKQVSEVKAELEQLRQYREDANKELEDLRAFKEAAKTAVKPTVGEKVRNRFGL